MILAIDPGNVQSAYVLMGADYRPVDYGKVDNAVLLGMIKPEHDVVLEMVASYGMGVGEEVFETVFWIGRFFERAVQTCNEAPRRLYRKDVKMNLCSSNRAKDGNIIIALVDRFGERKSKKNPDGWFPPQGSGWADDVWQAYALGVTALDKVPF
jgi:hypothetical protein